LAIEDSAIQTIVGFREATLSLTLDLSALPSLAWPEEAEDRELPLTPPIMPRLRRPGQLSAVAALFGALNALSVLSVSAVRADVPVGDVLRAVAESPTPPQVKQRRIVADDVWWASQRVWGPYQSSYDAVGGEPNMRTGKLDMEWLRVQGIDYSAGAARADVRLAYDIEPMQVRKLTLASPLELVVHLPWEWFAASGGGMVFVRAIEYWLNSPGRIRTVRARLSAEQSRYEAERMEAEIRKLRALADIEQLRMAQTPAIEAGSLELD